MAEDKRYYKEVFVTPQMAIKFILGKGRNRHPDRDRVREMANIMLAALWYINPASPLMFDTSGRLVNGQHRMWALLLAWRELGEPEGYGFRFLVAYNVTKQDIAVADAGPGGKRTVKDTLMIVGGVDHKTAIRLSSFTTGLVILEGRPYTKNHTHDGIQAMRRRYKNGITWGLEKFPNTKGLNQSSIASALVFAYNTAPVKVDEFADMIINGHGLKADDPAMAFRRWYERKSGQRDFTGRNSKERTEMAHRLLHSLHKFIHSEKVSKTMLATPDIIEFFAKNNSKPKKTASVAKPSLDDLEQLTADDEDKE